MVKSNNKLTARERSFCRYYATTCNSKEAAAYAGLPEPEKTGVLFLSKPHIRDEIKKIMNEQKLSGKTLAYIGYERLAFGSVCDAVRLLCLENSCKDELDKLDLFNIAEIKKPKDGSMEIKFFDRIKALEKLELLDESEDKLTSHFYDALNRRAKENNGDIESEF